MERQHVSGRPYTANVVMLGLTVPYVLKIADCDAGVTLL